MQIEFLNARGVDAALDRLIGEHDEYHWAVAWGTHNKTAKAALTQRRKFKAVTFGLSFAHSDPDLIDALCGIKGARVVTSFPGGTYHPKIYAFKTGKDVCAIVGSANFTPGGLKSNHEAAVMMTGTVNDDALADILAFCRDSAELGEPVTEELAARYRISCERSARLPRVPRDPIKDVSSNRIKALTSPVVNMSWAKYAKAIRGSQHHNVKQSLELLRIAQTWLAGVGSFAELSSPQRKAIAGILGAGERAAGTELDHDWGWFGSMQAAGDFTNRIAENDPWLAKAVDSIPLRGDVTEEAYDRFVELFRKAFSGAQRVGGASTASRLLAIKRPDVFLCVSKPNLVEAAHQMGFAKSTLNLENYWERVVEVVRAADWYNADKPDGRDGELWECRVAMLDAIFYRPD